MKIVLLGPPGSGKGTQGAMLAKKLNISRLSVGALIRRHASQKTLLGIRAEKYMKKGLAIPADIYIQMISPWLLKEKKGFVVDNLVRTKDQLLAFQKLEKEKKIRLDKVFYLKVDRQEAEKRLRIRRMVKIRPDESGKALHTRFRVFYEHTQEIFDYFAKQNIFYNIDANVPVNEIHNQIMSHIYFKKQTTA